MGACTLPPPPTQRFRRRPPLLNSHPPFFQSPHAPQLHLPPYQSLAPPHDPPPASPMPNLIQGPAANQARPKEVFRCHPSPTTSAPAAPSSPSRTPPNSRPSSTASAPPSNPPTRPRSS